MGRRTTPVDLGARTIDASNPPAAVRPPGNRAGADKTHDTARRAAPTQEERPGRRNARAAATSDALEPLLRNLLEHAARRAPADSIDTGCDDGDEDEHGARVLFDVEVDGARYQLLRSATPVAPVVTAASAAEDAAAHHSALSPREREIVRMVALGHPNKTIAAVLEISCWTVGTYLRRIFAKLNVGSRAAMVARVMEKDDRSKQGVSHPAIAPTRDEPHAARERAPVEASLAAPRSR